MREHWPDTTPTADLKESVIKMHCSASRLQLLHVRLHSCTHTNTHTHTHMRTHTQARLAHILSHTQRHRDTHMHTHTHIHICMHANGYKHANAHVHTSPQKHSRTPQQNADQALVGECFELVQSADARLLWRKVCVCVCCGG